MDETLSTSWRMTARGIAAAFSIAVRRLLWSKFMYQNYILCGIPVLICTIIAFSSVHHGRIQDIQPIYEGFLRTLYLHFIVFFMANIFGFAVVRQETEGQTLHYLLLQPIPRWALFAGRFLAYVAIVSTVCVLSQWLAYLILSLSAAGFPATVTELFGEGRFLTLAKESGVLVLGLMAYGTIAMLMGSYFKTGMYAVVLLVWEWTLPYAPLVLKRWTVLFYLQSLLPEKPERLGQIFEIFSEPEPAWVCIATLGSIAAVMLAAAMTIFHFKECQYAEN